MLILFEFSLPPPNKQNVRDDSRPAFIMHAHDSVNRLESQSFFMQNNGRGGRC